MTVIQLSDQEAAALKARAAAQGLTLEAWFRKLAKVVFLLYLATLLVCAIFAYQLSLDFITIAGVFWLGAFIGMVLGFYVQKNVTWNAKAITTSTSVVVGSGIVGFLSFISHETKEVHELWFYPIGLVGGFMFGTLWEFAAEKPPARATAPPSSRT